ncbi:MAG: hypothetical protein WA994_11660 [Ornithinimicrobium sp.]
MSCVVRYAGADYHVDDDASVVWTLIADRLNASYVRRDIPTLRKYFGAQDEDRRTVEGDGYDGQYDPFVVLPLVAGGVVVIHLHDAMNLAIKEVGGDLSPTNVFDDRA